MSTQTDFPRLNVVVADKETAAPVQDARISIDVGDEVNETQTVVNDRWEGVASFRIAPMYETVDVTVSHRLFEQETAEVEIDGHTTTEVFELSTATGTVTISPPSTVETNINMEIRPTDEQIRSIWDVDVGEVTVFPDEEDVISLPPGEYLFNVNPTDGDQLVVNPSRTVEIAPNEPMELDFQAPSVTTLPDPQLAQMKDISQRIDDIDDMPEHDTAVPRYLLSTAGGLVEMLETELDSGLPKHLRSRPVEEITATYLEAVSQAVSDTRAPLFEDETLDVFQAASDLEPVDREWAGPVSFDELRSNLNKNPPEAVNAFEVIENRVEGAIEEAEHELEHPTPLRDIFAALETPDTDDSLELIVHYYVLSRFWLALEDLLNDDALRQRLDRAPESDDRGEDADEGDDEDEGGFFDRF